MIEATIIALTIGFVVGLRQKRERCSSRDHEPMATRLLDGERFHVCKYVETMWGEDVLSICLTCRKPPPTSIPGPGELRLG